MFDEGEISFEIFFFDNEVIADHILFVLLYYSIESTVFFIRTPYAILTPGMSKGQIRDEKKSQTITVIGVTDENFNVSNVISDLVMPYKINDTIYFKYL